MNVECIIMITTQPARAELLTRRPGKSLGSGASPPSLSIWRQIRGDFQPLPAPGAFWPFPWCVAFYIVLPLTLLPSCHWSLAFRYQWALLPILGHLSFPFARVCLEPPPNSHSHTPSCSQCLRDRRPCNPPCKLCSGWEAVAHLVWFSFEAQRTCCYNWLTTLQ